jgi:hypothetical protein
LMINLLARWCFSPSGAALAYSWTPVVGAIEASGAETRTI